MDTASFSVVFPQEDTGVPHQDHRRLTVAQAPWARLELPVVQEPILPSCPWVPQRANMYSPLLLITLHGFLKMPFLQVNLTRGCNLISTGPILFFSRWLQWPATLKAISFETLCAGCCLSEEASLASTMGPRMCWWPRARLDPLKINKKSTTFWTEGVVSW